MREKRKPFDKSKLTLRQSVAKRLATEPEHWFEIPFDLRLHGIVLGAMIIYWELDHKIGLELHLMELIAGGLNLLNLILVRRQNPLGLVYGMICCTLFCIHYFNIGIYGQATLQIYFIIMQSISFRKWTHCEGDNCPLPTFLSWKARLGVILYGGGILSALLLGGVRRLYTLDYTNVSLNLLNQFLLMNKKAEYWLVALCTNTCAIMLFYLAHSYVAMLICCFAFINAATAFPVWYKKAKNTKKPRAKSRTTKRRKA